MAPEIEYRPIIETNSPAVEVTVKQWQQCGVLMANYFRQGNALLLDIDGVVCKADALVNPELTTQEIIPALKKLENLGVKLGVATARGVQIVEYLRDEHGLQINGPAILEEGQVFINDGHKNYLSVPNHPRFIADVRHILKLQPTFQESWQQVRTLFESNRALTFCPGNFQWQGECRASFWFFAHGEKDNDREVLATIFEPILRELALENGIDYEQDLAVSVGRMSVGNLGIVSMKGKVNGLPVNKGTAAEKLTQPWVFVADGFGDTPLAYVTKRRNGAVIGIEGNLDDSNEPPEFLRNADYVLSDPEEFAKALNYATICLKES